MHHYDVAAKVLIESCGAEIIRQFVGIETEEFTIIETLPQETVSLKRSDYPVLVKDIHGIIHMIILEIQTKWNRHVPLNLLDYRTRYLLKHDHEVISCVILLRPSNTADDCYRDNEVCFRYRLVKIYEMDAKQIISEQLICLMPFVPLMKNGEESLTEADNLIYQSDRTKVQKADMLTSMAILAGLISEDMPAKLIARRKDIMIESAAYDIIRTEGFQDGIQQGIQQGNP